MGPRITIDFRDTVHPSRRWILGVGDGRARVELVPVDGAPKGGDGLDGSADTTAAAVGATRPGVAPGRRLAENSGRVPVDVRAVVAAPPLAGSCTCPEFCERDHANE